MSILSWLKGRRSEVRSEVALAGRLNRAFLTYLESVRDYAGGWLQGNSREWLAQVDARGNAALRKTLALLKSGAPSGLVEARIANFLISDLGDSDVLSPRSQRKALAHEMLVRISGRDLGSSAAPWKEWLESHSRHVARLEYNQCWRARKKTPDDDA